MELGTLITHLQSLPIEDRIEAINAVKIALHAISPFKNEPVDCVLWVKNEQVDPNNYNPNSVAPPEMKLLELSISHDGYTQPIVTMRKDANEFEVIDGFHRKRVGKESKDVKKRTLGYLPVVVANAPNYELKDRIAATIRHNRARGKHAVESMGNLVKELVIKGWDDTTISKHLGMEAEEVLRLKQVVGFAGLFKDTNFSDSWTWENENSD